MKFFQRCSLNQFQAIFAFKYHSKTHFKGYLKPPKANQALKGYLNSNCTRQVLSLFREILRENPSTIDSFSFLYVLKACIQKSTFLEGKQLHALVMKFGFESIIHLQTLLVNVYSVTGNLLDAQQVFDEMPVRNVVCWTALISAYVDNQRPGKALQLFRQMQMDNVGPDKVTLTVTLSACADLGALEMGEWMHAFIRRKQGFSSDLSLNNALINMYVKCGDMKNARRLFGSIEKKDVTTWTSLMVGHALHGEAKEALELFEEMKAMNSNPRKRNSGCSSSSILPNHVTFLGVLMACSHAGMIDEGKHHFRSMSKDYGLNPRDSHFGCMVDLFCRAGKLEEAYNFISAMRVQPNAVVWRTLLGACSLQGNIKLGQEVRHKLLELEPNYVGDYVAMSNIFAAKGMWDEKMVAREQIKQCRDPGCSSIEVGSGISEFVASAFDHPLSNQIHEVLRNLTVTMRAYGYCPHGYCPHDA